MARLKHVPVSNAHLLCLMEMWFDASVPLVRELAEFDYTLHPDGSIGCPFCGAWLPVEAAQFVEDGRAKFNHADSCPTLQALELLGDMIEPET